MLGRPVRLKEQSPRRQARGRLLTNPWMNGPLADSLLDMLAVSSGVRECIFKPTVADVLGRPPLPFARWVEDHRDAFEPVA